MTNWWETPTRIDVPPVEPTPQPQPSASVPTGVTNTEPVALGGALMGVVSAAMAVLVEFDVWSPTEHQTSLLFVLLTSLITFVTVLQRGKVWSPASHQAAVAEAKRGAV